MSARVVITPVWTNRPLSPDIPHVESDSSTRNGLDVESLRGSHIRQFLRRQLLQKGRLPCIVQSKEKNANLLLRGRFEGTNEVEETHSEDRKEKGKKTRKVRKR
ncbi:hypothetical protein PMAYCL1PPCAC_07026 [Pristionchus mayeri]|uniref:Uncharacterized protein n=1 Tax=Pristionchus mayeri TaxID=1317129 RepID=A0AAN5CCW5_9BILA|nr:hypothetical protein PMAYCL1PPCAC_07026 [Pristionchus mayeri]